MMRTVRRLLYADILGAVAFVAAAFLSLFYFIDFVEELSDVGQGGYGAANAAWMCLLQVPAHLYELMPIAVLIGAIYAMARSAQASEFTILRTSGLSPMRALSMLGLLGLGFAAFTLLVGDVAAPGAQRHATLYKADFFGGVGLGRTGAWLKDTQTDAQGTRHFSINVAEAVGDGELRGIRIFELDTQGRLVARIEAQRARVGEGHWSLQQVKTLHSTRGDATGIAEAWVGESRDTMDWPTALASPVVAAATLPVKTMTTAALFTYMRHLMAHDQEARKYEIAFWQRAVYPLACVVMMGLALPFAYLQARSGGISVKVFGGIMLGISFVLLNNVSSHIGQLQQWTPWVAAAAPGVLFLVLSMTAFAWLVHNR